ERRCQCLEHSVIKRRSDIPRAGHHADSRRGGCDILEDLQPFAYQGEIWIAEPSDITVRPSETLDDALADRIGDSNEHDWDAPGLPLQGHHHIGGTGKDDIGTQSHEFFGVCDDAFEVATPANVDLDVAAIGPTQLFQCLLELGEQHACFRIVVASDKHADATHSLSLLPTRR